MTDIDVGLYAFGAVVFLVLLAMSLGIARWLQSRTERREQRRRWP